MFAEGVKKRKVVAACNKSFRKHRLAGSRGLRRRRQSNGSPSRHAAETRLPAMYTRNQACGLTLLCLLWSMYE
ncbi:hypothetical protein VTJ04DRAFT_2880 [Mycothermus thermophilus]|uniref:uncharacterized protein n=1 Tax=Humicola insolens TaxID=85995 RepID=UPI003743DDCE